MGEELMTRIVVIGAGVMALGCRSDGAGGHLGDRAGSRAYWRRHLELQLRLDQFQLEDPACLSRAERRGHEGPRGIGDELGATPWWHGGGNVEWTAPEQRAAQQASVERLQSWGYAAEWITSGQLLELEPDIDPAVIGDAPIAYFPEEGWLDPVVYVAAMLGAARSHGASVIGNAQVAELVVRGGRVTGVKTADGRLFEADMVVNCAGRWANDPVSDAGMHLPLAPTVGFLVFTPPVAARVGRVVHAPIIQARPDVPGVSSHGMRRTRRSRLIRSRARRCRKRTTSCSACGGCYR